MLPGACTMPPPLPPPLPPPARRPPTVAGPRPSRQVCAGSGIAFPQPRKPAGKPPELVRRLEELRARLEQQQYDAMVADVTQVGRLAGGARAGWQAGRRSRGCWLQGWQAELGLLTPLAAQRAAWRPRRAALSRRPA